MSVHQRQPVTRRRAMLMATCLCDTFFDDVAVSTVKVLRHAGCEVDFPRDQTCCGQPAYTAGDWPGFRRLVRRLVDVFAGDVPVVVPSGACAATLRHAAPQAFRDEPDLAAVEALAGRTWELCEFLVSGLGVRQWPGRLEARVSLHPGCHNWNTPVLDAARQLLDSVAGVERVEAEGPAECCGFGGVFSVAFPHVSGAMGRRRVAALMTSSPDLVVSPDVSCLMHQKGLARHDGKPFPAMHIAQLLNRALGES
ncbi:MAG: (Fe-S)-binding protein [Gammaproteobacteria bacterium]